jgi:hypothetical protein
VTRRYRSAHDFIVEDYLAAENEDPNRQPRRLVQEENEMDHTNIDWDAFVQSVYEQDERDRNHRELSLDYSNVDWNNYFAMIGCRTEYYYRYSGTQTVPPCYGRFRGGSNNKVNTNNWRVMKDPIRVSERQINELHRLIRTRIAPSDDPVAACKPDTAAATPDPDTPNRISVARPLQENDEAHWMVYCECENWGSKWIEDRIYCQLDRDERFFDHPYHFKTNGF